MRTIHQYTLLLDVLNLQGLHLVVYLEHLKELKAEIIHLTWNVKELILEEVQQNHDNS